MTAANFRIYDLAVSDVPDPDRLPFTPLRELGLIGISVDLHVTEGWGSSRHNYGLDMVHLRFNDGVTAIYGPNGTGKSRVLTAVGEVFSPGALNRLFSGSVFMSEIALERPMNLRSWDDKGPCEGLIAMSGLSERSPELAAEFVGQGLLALGVAEEAVTLGAAVSQDPPPPETAAVLARLQSQVLAPFEEKKNLNKYFDEQSLWKGDETAEEWVDVGAYLTFLVNDDGYSGNAYLDQLAGLTENAPIPCQEWAIKSLDPRRPSFLPLPLEPVSYKRAPRFGLDSPRPRVTVLELDNLADRVPTFEAPPGLIGPHPAAVSVRQAAACADLANTICRLLLVDPPALSFKVEGRRIMSVDDSDALATAIVDGSFRWAFGTTPSWVAEDRSGAVVGLDELSATQERWAELALALSWEVLRHSGNLRVPDDLLNEYDNHPTPKGWGLLLLCDEPEAGLPIQAQKRLSRGLKRLTDEFGITVITATHSGVMLEEPSVTPVRLDRDDERGDSYRVVATQVEPDERDRLRSAGVPPSELLHLYRTLLVVEGRHDEWLIDELIGDELADLGVKVVPAHGTAQAARFFATEAGFLFDHLPDLNFVIAFDSVRHDVAVEMYLAASDAANHAERMQRLDDIVRRHGKASPEEGTLRTLLDRASEQGRFERIGGLHGFSEPDIIDYLNCDQVLPGRTWENLRAEHDEARSTRKGIPGDFKRYLAITYDVEFNEELIRSAAPRDSIPDDFTLLLERCQLATRPSD